jgi:biopolymer transport protein ExbB
MTDPLLPLLAAAPGDGLNAALEFLKKGGFFMIPLAVVSVIGLMAVLYKFLSLSRSRVVPDALARQVEDFERSMAEDRAEPILREFQQGGSVLARLGAVAVKHRGRPLADITQAIEASSREESVRLLAGIGVLDTVITIAPLLGLLGTASGLVTTFEGLGETTDHTAIARGIAIALSTTIFGLTIAVPCVIAHSYFTRRIDTLTARLETLLSDLAHVCHRAGPNP